MEESVATRAKDEKCRDVAVVSVASDTSSRSCASSGYGGDRKG